LPPELGAPLPDPDHVLRYIGKKHIDDGVVNGSGFLARVGEDAPSVNWMECFLGPAANQVAEISARRRIRYERRAQLAQLNVGQTKNYVAENAPMLVKLSFLHDPLAAETTLSEDLSHAIINGVPAPNTPEGELVGDLLVGCIMILYPVVPD
jgi:hypothetical protein